MDQNSLIIAEIPFDTGQPHFRYARYLADDGTRWIRHGLFHAFHRNGQLASEGQYEHGVECGPWRDYHENGRIAAIGSYEKGNRVGIWRFYSDDGSFDGQEDFGTAIVGP